MQPKILEIIFNGNSGTNRIIKSNAINFSWTENIEQFPKIISWRFLVFLINYLFFYHRFFIFGLRDLSY